MHDTAFYCSSDKRTHELYEIFIGTAPRFGKRMFVKKSNRTVRHAVHLNARSNVGSPKVYFPDRVIRPPFFFEVLNRKNTFSPERKTCERKFERNLRTHGKFFAAIVRIFYPHHSSEYMRDEAALNVQCIGTKPQCIGDLFFRGFSTG